MRKTLLALAFSCILLTIFSCGKDNDSKPSIVGKWTLSSYQEYYYENGSSEPADSFVYDPNLDGVTTYTFNSDKTLVSESGGNTENGTYSYNEADKKLTFTNNGIDDLYDVQELSAHTLKLYDEYSDTDDDDNSFKIVVNVNFKR